MNLLCVLLITLLSSCKPNISQPYIVSSLSDVVYTETTLSVDMAKTIDLGSRLKVIKELQEVSLGIFEGKWYEVEYNETIYYLPSFMTTKYNLINNEEFDLEKFMISNNLKYEYNQEDYFYSKGIYEFDQGGIASTYFLMKMFLKNLELPSEVKSKHLEGNPIMDFSIYGTINDFLDIKWMYDGGIIELKIHSSEEGIKVQLIEDRA